MVFLQILEEKKKQADGKNARFPKINYRICNLHIDWPIFKKAIF